MKKLKYQKIEKEQKLRSQKLIELFKNINLNSVNANAYYEKAMIDLDVKKHLYSDTQLKRHVLELDRILSKDYYSNKKKKENAKRKKKRKEAKKIIEEVRKSESKRKRNRKRLKKTTKISQSI